MKYLKFLFALVVVALLGLQTYYDSEKVERLKPLKALEGIRGELAAFNRQVNELDPKLVNENLGQLTLRVSELGSRVEEIHKRAFPARKKR